MTFHHASGVLYLRICTYLFILYRKFRNSALIEKYIFGDSERSLVSPKVNATHLA